MDADFLLIRRMKAGEDGAIEVFVRKYYPAVLRCCYLHLSDKSYAKDATQESFARFFRTLSQYQHYGKAQRKNCPASLSVRADLLLLEHRVLPAALF